MPTVVLEAQSSDRSRSGGAGPFAGLLERIGLALTEEPELYLPRIRKQVQVQRERSLGRYSPAGRARR
jgi:hypothetical protein